MGAVRREGAAGGGAAEGAAGSARPKAARNRRMPRAVREKQMLDAAVRVFAAQGYQAASMDEIARRAGVSKPLVYLYLHSKEELFSACVERESRALMTAVLRGVDVRQPADRQLWDGLRSFFLHTAEHPDGWAVFHTRARTHEPFATAAAKVREDMVSFVTALIHAAHREQAQHGPLPGPPAGAEGKEREAVALAQALVGAAESLAGWALTDSRTGGMSADQASATGANQAAATMMNFAWAGLGNLLEGRPWTAAAAQPTG